MKNWIYRTLPVTRRINTRHIQVLLALLTLAMLVLGAGAPGMDGGSGGW